MFSFRFFKALKNKNDSEGTVLGRYYYDAENGPSLQRFKPQVCCFMLSSIFIIL